MRRVTPLFSLFAAAAFSQNRFGGIPLPNLTASARAGHKKNWTGTPQKQTSHTHNGMHERMRRLKFKAKHGYFASEPELIAQKKIWAEVLKEI